MFFKVVLQKVFTTANCVCGSALSTGSWAGPRWPRPPGAGPSRRRAPPSACSPGTLSSPPARRRHLQQLHQRHPAGASGTIIPLWRSVSSLKTRRYRMRLFTSSTGADGWGESAYHEHLLFLFYLFFIISFGSLQECQTQTHYTVKMSNLVKVTERQ